MYIWMYTCEKSSNDICNFYVFDSERQAGRKECKNEMFLSLGGCSFLPFSILFLVSDQITDHKNRCSYLDVLLMALL